MSNTDGLHLPELDKLVNEIKTGQRVLLFPPGIFLFVGILIITMIGTGGFIAMSGPLLKSYLSTNLIIKIHLICMALGTAVLVISGIMITRGRKKFKFFLKAIIMLVSMGLTGLTLFYFFNSEQNKSIYLFVFLSSWFTLNLTRHPIFTLFCEFYYRLKK